MGTRGFRIVKFKGRYWILYNHWDSYPEGIGQSLVDGIPTDPEQYKQWLQAQRDYYAKWDSLLQRLLCLEPEDLGKPGHGRSDLQIWGSAFDERLDPGQPPSYSPGFNDLYIEWTYTIDLDLEVFSVDSGAHFRLNQIPKDSWIKSLAVNHEGRFAFPQFVPDGSLTSLVVESEDFDSSTLKHYKTLNVRTVVPKSWDPQTTSRNVLDRLRLKAYDAFQKSQEECLSTTLLSWTAQDLSFREIAYFILCLAAGSDYLSFVDTRRVMSGPDGHSYEVIVANPGSGRNLEMISPLGMGYHMNGYPQGSAPEGSKYWLGGALICLVSRLDRQNVLDAAIADAVRSGRMERPRSSFNCLLISIGHVVLIRSLSNGLVDHTDLLPLFSIPIHLSKDAVGRYGDEAVQALYEAESRVKTDSDALDNESQNEGSDQDDEEAEVQGAEDSQDLKSLETTQSVWTVQQTFASLIYFFEATALEMLKPEAAGRRLPNEICEMILSNISDVQTYNSCMRVSRQFRTICQQRPVLLDGEVLLDLKPTDPKSDSQGEVQGNKSQNQPNKLQAPEFCARDLSTGRQMDVEIRFGRADRKSTSTSYKIITGNESHRKTFAPFHMVVKGLDSTAPKVEVPHCKSQYHVCRNIDPEHTNDFWGGVFTNFKDSRDTSTRSLLDSWKGAMKKLGLREQRELGPDWILPPNTRELEAAYEEWDTDVRFNYLILRLKRPSEYWHSLWDDLIFEAKGSLDLIDDEKRRPSKGRVNQVRGADSPFVMLALGMEVRLFKWEQPKLANQHGEDIVTKNPQSGTLNELEPDRIYSVCEAEDRKVIEEYVKAVKDHRKVLKKKLGKGGQVRKTYMEIGESESEEAAEDEVAEYKGAEDKAAQDEGAEDKTAEDEGAEDNADQDVTTQDDAAKLDTAIIS